MARLAAVAVAVPVTAGMEMARRTHSAQVRQTARRSGPDLVCLALAAVVAAVAAVVLGIAAVAVELAVVVRFLGVWLLGQIERLVEGPPQMCFVLHGFCGAVTRE